MNTISLSPDQFTKDDLYFLLRDSIIPRPIAWVSSIDANGVTNLAPFSFFNVCSANPPILGFCCGAKDEDVATGAFSVKDTLSNVKATRQFVINIVPENLAEEMVRTSDPLPPHESEFEHAGLTSAPSARVAPPRVVGSPVAYECELFSVTPLGANAWVMGRVIHVHIDERIYVGKKRDLNHRVDTLKHTELRPYARLGGAFYSRLREIETMARKDGG
jgi:flavin reductase (DIM6/NTAB) family NADH-FMN oxidoreductase RutF